MTSDTSPRTPSAAPPATPPAVLAGARRRLVRSDRAALAIMLVLVGVAYLPTLRELVAYWASYPEYSHGFLMPGIAAWLLWERRGDWARLEPRPSAFGIALLLPSLALLLLGEMKLSWFLKPYALVATLAAVTWAFLGLRMLRATFPAWVALLLACPLPGRVQEAISVPLKHASAVLATGLLDLTGVPTALDGNLIHVQGIQDLWVADACSGIRSLIALGSLAILACFVWRRPWPLKAAVLLSVVPLAILVNGLRIFVTGELSVHAGPGAAQGFFHLFEGFALFGVAALLLWAWAALLSRTFVRGAA